MEEIKNLESNEFEPIIGLEVHIQMNTETKLFCGCSAGYSDKPNTNVCPVCLGHPGVLPVLNENAAGYGIKMALAVNTRINGKSFFSRKNYFYPDLPKGYQITQYELPLCENGYVIIRKKNGFYKRIGITRIHLEEDAAKSIHSDITGETLLDFNRSGIPLLEIVTEPEISSPEEAFLFLKKIHQLLQYLNISTGNMEEGAMRCDANISVKIDGKSGSRTEIKNLNSFKSVYDGLKSEIQRQVKAYSEGGKVQPATLKYNQKNKATILVRSKEEDYEYRYFDEPDLPPLIVTGNMIKKMQESMPEMPEKKYSRFINEYSLPEDAAERLTADIEISDYFENLVKESGAENPGQFCLCANWILSEILNILNDKKIKISEFKLSEKQTAGLLKYIIGEKINLNSAKNIFAIMYEKGTDADAIIKEKDLLQITNESVIFSIIRNVIDSHPDEFLELKNGKEKLKGFFVGLIMNESKGKANPKIVNEIINNLIN